MSEEDVWIGGTDIQIGMNGFIDQPKEIIEYIKYLQKEKERLKARESKMESRVIELTCSINEFKDILYSYGEIFDSKLLQEMQEQLLKVLKKVDTDPDFASNK